ncbi:putative transcriptional regulatory protein [Wickerhamomyces ciferrii]|uniref:Transcriptional regulatory protein n=1 Tax=Wickerhamomyces ciferrii (strain ATCC 14091 / BCRC 22168 / CBS 111 / JCM 3599 / NBRC 0793 / NRRL Y-1031 F-60-10) TaxID=1206466 RepID=K0KM33_WICCF|nr:putative transcriptional regulatory protein [Wickerhamomyces ciferrii]CCH42434.1 putative transcriptional regulatory protein [Wickerhamomyces ciferrii]
MTESNTTTPAKEPSATSPAKDGEKQQRKRMRVPTSCSVCLKPVCGSCTKSSVSHLCFYEEPSWISSDELLKHAKQGKQSQDHQSNNVVNSDNNGSSLNVNDLSPAVQSKIESLNDKIKQLEASIAVTELSRSTLPAFNSIHTNQNSVSPQPQHQHQHQQNQQQRQHDHNNQQHQSQNYYQPQQAPYFSQPIMTPQPTIPNNQQFYQQRPSSINIPSSIPQTAPVSIPPLNDSTASSSTYDNKYDLDLNEKVDLYGFFPFMIKKRRLECHGPLSLLSCMKRDIFLRVLWSHVWKTLEHARIQALEIEKAKKQTNDVDDDDDNSQKNPPKACDLIDHIDPITTQTITQGKSSTLHKELKKAKMASKIENFKNSNKSIDQIILESLPSRKIIMILIFRFFKFVYPFLPFVDEGTFLFELETICPIDYQDSNVESLNISNKYDYCIIGLLLLIIKLGYLSITEEELESKPDLKPLQGYKPNSNLITAVKLCLDQYKHWRKPFCLRFMQLYLYFRLYFKFCPEDDDVNDSSESQILLGSLFSNAYALGLHRDPNILAEMTKTSKRKVHAETWRKVWYKLLELDTTESIVTGLPLHVIDDRSYDTKLPSEDDDYDETDKFIVKDFKFVQLKNDLFRQVSIAILNIKNQPNVKDILHLIKKLEVFQSSQIGSLKDILNDSSLSKYAIVKKVTYLFEVSTILLNLNTIMFEFYQKKSNTKRTLEFLESSLKISLRIINTAMNLAYNENLYVGKGFSYYFKPHGSNPIVRAFLFLTSIALRLSQVKKLAIRNNEQSTTRFNIYEKFSNLIIFNMENTLQLLTKMSSSHYNFSRLVTASSILCHVIKKPDFDFDQAGLSAVGDKTGNDNLMHNHLQDLTVEDLPSNNIFSELLESELLHLMDFTNSSLVTILQPVIKKSKKSQNNSNNNQNNQNQNNQNNQNSFNDSNNGYNSNSSGQFYDPINGLTKRSSSLSTDSSSNFNLSPSAINQNNIFNLDNEDLNKLLGVPNLDDLNNQTFGKFESNFGSISEEYASLFGMFDEINNEAEAIGKF